MLLLYPKQQHFMIRGKKMVANSDVLQLSRKLIKCRSVTPKNDGAMEIVEYELLRAGFECFRVDRGGICNLFARWGEKNHKKTFGFNGHTDVVPEGDISSWSCDPFGGVIKNGLLYGRGAADMKTAVAAFVIAAKEVSEEFVFDGALVIMLTGDEEADATDGTIAILDWMKANDESMSVCLVGEPTCSEAMGDTIKIGRRGSLSAVITLQGVQGHSAYPERALNPLPIVAKLVSRITDHELDQGTDYFDPSTLTITSIDTGNTATNVIPQSCEVMLNIRFNDAHSSESLLNWLEFEAQKIENESRVKVSIKAKVSGESFITKPGELSNLALSAIYKIIGTEAKLSTSGGTSDARFVREHCPVVEFGLLGNTLHQVDEHVKVEHVDQLKIIYKSMLINYLVE